MSRLRISAISYLNTAPLMWDFDHGKVKDDFDISYTLPSSCAAALKAATADIGIIPAAAYTTVPNLVILPGVAIAARRAVRSILLVSKVPLDKIETVALDTSSLTSVALIKVLLSKSFGARHRFDSMEPNVEVMLREHDSALVIGDPALQVDRSRYLTFDLAEEWIRFTRKPFVFAFWAVRSEALRYHPTLDLAHIFQTSRDHGLERENVHYLARRWASKLGIAEEVIRTYLTENIYYWLDSPCLAGMQLFYQYAADLGILPQAPPLGFVEAAKSVAS
jgi:chorismate dehydratase